MVTNYKRGSDFERWIVKEFEKEGHYAIRSAGSKKQADVIAFTDYGVIFIQAKVVGANSKTSFKKEIEELKKLKLPKCPNCIESFIRKEFWVKRMINKTKSNIERLTV